MLALAHYRRLVLGLSLLLSPAAVAIGCKSEASKDDANSGGSGGAGGSGSEGPAVLCAFGEDAKKCGHDETQACGPSLEDQGTSCTKDGDCADHELCFALEENSTQGTCLLITGECVDVGVSRSGKSFGQACDPNAKQDVCAGTCVPIGSDGQGECEETCRVGANAGCGSSDLTSAAVACAFFAYELEDAGYSQGAGDLGICAALCHCNADCPGDQLCLNNPLGDYAGICAGGISEAEAIADCAMGGAGGAGGADGGSAG